MTAISALPQPSLRIRLAKVVLEEYRRWGSYDRLAIEIAAVNRPADEHKLNRHKVDRRKLKKIAQQEKVSLSPDELEALNTYLIGFGKGLAAIFGQPSIVKSLVETGQVTFLLGSRPRDESPHDRTGGLGLPHHGRHDAERLPGGAHRSNGGRRGLSAKWQR